MGNAVPVGVDDRGHQLFTGDIVVQTVDGEPLRQFAAFIGKLRIQVDMMGLAADEIVYFC